MDAAYLKLNVYDALTEAMSALSAKAPDDKIEFLGQYLIQYVERKKVNDIKLAESKVAESRYEELIKQETQQQIVLEAKKREEDEVKVKLTRFIDGLLLSSSNSSKKETMDKITNFISSYLELPAVYIAVKKSMEEREVLCYTSAAPDNQATVVGKKLIKVEYDAEDEEAPSRQGISFDAFFVPEIPEEEELEEGEEAKPKLPPPTAQPLIIENVMREKRIKFYGIPKLGSYVAVPLSYMTSEHEYGCVPKSLEDDASENDAAAEEDEEEEDEDKKKAEVKKKSNEIVAPKFREEKIKQDLIIGFDSIGKYRQFTTNEIAIVKQVGEVMLKIFEQRDQTDVESQRANLLHQLSNEVAINKVYEEIKTAEADYLVAASAEPESEPEPEPEPVEPPKPVEHDEENDDGEGEEGEGENEEVVEKELPPPVLESLKPYEVSVAVLKLWTQYLSADPLQSAITSLSGHVLPISPSAVNLLYTIMTMVHISTQSLRDEFGDISWERIKVNGISQLVAAMNAYDPMIRTVPKEASLPNIRAAIENLNLADGTIYPSYLPIFQILSTWLLKAVNARENSAIYHREANDDEELEIIS